MPLSMGLRMLKVNRGLRSGGISNVGELGVDIVQILLQSPQAGSFK